MTDVHPDILEVALDRCSGGDFEKFAESFLSASLEEDFVPVGGVHDGGADGTLESVRYLKSNVSTYFQFSVTPDFKQKIRQTVKRLRNVGRDPQNLYYATNRVLQNHDLVADDLGNELGLTVRIRNKKYFLSHANDNVGTQAAFRYHLEKYTDFLNYVGASSFRPVQNVPNPEIFVFLRQELDLSKGQEGLVAPIADSLILWALEGTDPDQNKFRSRDDILDRIEGAIPHAKGFVSGIIDHRLNILSSKKNVNGREVRAHRKEGLYVLPFETRKLVHKENISDEALRIRTRDGFAARARLLSNKEVEPEFLDRVSMICIAAISLNFEKEGMNFAQYVQDPSADERPPSFISDHIIEVCDSIDIPNGEMGVHIETSLRVLREALYHSESHERDYFGKLSRTYSLLFALGSSPKIAEYFQRMSSDFYLYIGTDILVRCLTEHYLDEEDRMTSNLLKILSKAGARLVLTETVLDEVRGNLVSADKEYENHYCHLESYLDYDLARQPDKILVRAYFYTKLFPTLRKPPAGWKSFIGQFCTYESLRNNYGKDELLTFLIEEFLMEYEDNDELHQMVEQEEVERLTKEIIDKTDKQEFLAAHDALMILSVYGRRKDLKERAGASSFGYRTWWLTHENRVRKATKDLVKERASHYIIRPEFLLNFISFAPSAAEVRNTYSSIFPTLLGIKLSGRMRPEILTTMLDKAAEAKSVSESRYKAKLSSIANELKARISRSYTARTGGNSIDDFFSDEL